MPQTQESTPAASASAAGSAGPSAGTSSNPSASQPGSVSSPALTFRDSDEGLGMLGRPAADVSSVLWRSLATAVIIGVLLWAGIKGFKKLVPGVASNRGKNISLQETLFLAPGRAVHLIKVGKKSLLVACSRDRMNLLADVTGAVSTDEPQPSAAQEPAK
jgi:flagellar biogenesis protein FliO